MADTTLTIPVTNTPVDIEAVYSLDAGTYFCQNAGSYVILVRQEEVALSDTDVIDTKKGHPILAANQFRHPGDLTIVTDGTGATYIYTPEAGKSSTMALTAVQ